MINWTHYTRRRLIIHLVQAYCFTDTVRPREVTGLAKAHGRGGVEVGGLSLE